MNVPRRILTKIYLVLFVFTMTNFCHLALKVEIFTVTCFN